MKTLIFFFSLMLSLSSFASGIDTVKNVLEQNEVVDLETKLAEKGFNLTKVTDKYAENGIRPRCICESFELAFTKYVAGGNKTEVYSVGITGFGNNQKVLIRKSK
jgi:hypothetical protein